MKRIVSANPFRCRMWNLHDRLEHYVDEASCKAEIESVQKHGQLVPALGRQLKGDPNHEIELIYGARRLFVARQLNTSLLVELRDMNDEEAIVAMDIENRHRLDISAYERGMSYVRLLRSGHFKSQEDIARALKVSASQVSRLIKIALLPSVVIGAFRSPMDICETWGLDLAEALADPARRGPTLARARAIAVSKTRPPTRQIYRQLLSASVSGRKPPVQHRDEVMRGRDGKHLYRVRHQARTVALLLPVERLSADMLGQITSTVNEIMQKDASHVPSHLPGASRADWLAMSGRC